MCCQHLEEWLPHFRCAQTVDWLTDWIRGVKMSSHSCIPPVSPDTVLPPESPCKWIHREQEGGSQSRGDNWSTSELEKGEERVDKERPGWSSHPQLCWPHRLSEGTIRGTLVLDIHHLFGPRGFGLPPVREGIPESAVRCYRKCTQSKLAAFSSPSPLIFSFGSTGGCSHDIKWVGFTTLPTPHPVLFSLLWDPLLLYSVPEWSLAHMLGKEKLSVSGLTSQGKKKKKKKGQLVVCSSCAFCKGCCQQGMTPRG